MFLLLLARALGLFAFDEFVLAPQREAALVAATTETVKAEAGNGSKTISEKSIAVLPFINAEARTRTTNTSPTASPRKSSMRSRR